jgi:hypothetical protein
LSRSYGFASTLSTRATAAKIAKYLSRVVRQQKGYNLGVIEKLYFCHHLLIMIGLFFMKIKNSF